ncbi:MAG: phosphotransferase [Anaerolineales bacterium]
MDYSWLRTILPRVLIVDNNERISQSYKRLVQHWGFAPVIATGKGSKLIENAKSLARQERCQFAIVDMRLIDDLDTEDLSGIELVAHLQPAICILVSASADLECAQKSFKAGAAAFLGKDQGPEPLKENLLLFARTRCANMRRLEIGPPEMLEYIAKALSKYIPDAYHDQIVDVLAQLFPKAQTLTLEKIGADVQSPQFSSAPRPRSVILRIIEDDKEPVIVKIARRHKIEIEHKKYDEFIDDRLVGQYRTILSKSTLLWDIGGAELTNVGISARSFSDMLRTESAEKLVICLERFFTSIWSSHYKKATSKNHASLFQLYCDVWGPEWAERARALMDFDPARVMESSGWYTANAPHPIRWFFERIVENPTNDASHIEHTYTAVTHGDLHGDNLLVDEFLNAWVIDFERSGPGHILQDFAELESDIITRLDCGQHYLGNFYALCLSICQPSELGGLPGVEPAAPPNNPYQKALHIIHHLRRLARQCTPITSAREYLLGLFFNTIFRATLIEQDHIPCQHRALMLASILAHRLEHWDEPWPPPDWPTPQGG